MGHRDFTKLDVAAAMKRIEAMTKDIQEMTAYAAQFPYFDTHMPIVSLKSAADAFEAAVYDRGDRDARLQK